MHDDKIPDVYAECLKVDEVDYLRNDHAVEGLRRIKQAHERATPIVYPLSSKPRDQYGRHVEVVNLALDDPWRQAYLAVLGNLPEQPEPRFVDQYDLLEGLSYDQFIPIERVEAQGSLGDLVDRLQARNRLTPRQLSTLYLAHGMKPDTSYLGAAPTFPSRHAIRRAVGPNIVVVLGPGSVDDLAYLWNLRAAHGDHYTMPIGIPFELLSEDAISFLQEPGRAAMFGFAGGKIHLTSWSLPSEAVLKRVPRQSNPFVEPRELFTFGPSAGRHGSQITFWSSGRTSLMPLLEAEGDVLSAVAGSFRGGTLTLDVRLSEYPLPSDETMRGVEFGPTFRGGAAQVRVHELRRKETVDVAWPSAWTSLEAVARTRGLSVSSSDPGTAALSIVHSLGGIDQIRWLLHEPLIDLFYRIAERSGMAYWKDRWRKAEAALRSRGVAEADLEAVALTHGRDDLAIAPSGEGREIGFDKFKAALAGRPEAAKHWVAWAERKHLLVRGTTVKCPDCKASTWLPMSSLPPPVGCVGCGREIDQPYGADLLKFTYRLGESLRRVLEMDCLGHLFALHWFWRVFGGRGTLVGGHPGVTFKDRASKRDIGEADVALLFSDGSLVPLEVKRTVRGLGAEAIELMDTLRDRLGSSWDAFAITQPASECTAAAAFRRQMPDLPRFMMSYDQLLDPHPVVALGADPFEWDPNGQERTSRRQKEFIQRVVQGNLDKPYDFVSASLLREE
ncbi:hypothetical protein WIS52_14860 [Pseudonocardia nematodicida]|uniref:REase associating with pPIWI RE domain-containing protein n=1 Tax=Pseudonocardia nematodicida TaxID=1206997 RepID=A0ABV1KDQ0_9PSEU